MKLKNNATLDEKITYYFNKFNCELNEETVKCFKYFIQSSEKKSFNYKSFFEILKSMMTTEYPLKLSERYIKFKNINKQIRSLEKYQLRYGIDEGTERFNSYCKKQGESNTFEYKHKKYGWDEEKFNEFNRSRSTTLKNCIEKYGEEEGTQRFNDYCEKQAYAGCKEEYFIEKYGEEEGKRKYLELNRKKSVHMNLDYYVNKYGEEEGKRKHLERYSKIPSLYSSVSQELFIELDSKNHNIFCESKYGSKNEEQMFVNEASNCRYYADFVYKNKIIEFNGVYWHCSPRYYQGDEIIKRYFNGKPRIITVSDVWNKDKMKLDFFKSQGYDVLVVWEDDYYKDKNEVINKCMEFLYGND